MSLSDGFFRSLETHYINGRLRDVPRWRPSAEQTAKKTQTTSTAQTGACSAWLPPRLQRIIARHEQTKLPEEEQAAVLQALAPLASIVLGDTDFQMKRSTTYGAWLEGPVDRTLVLCYEPLLKRPPSLTLWDSLDVMAGQLLHDACYLKELELAKARSAKLEDTLHAQSGKTGELATSKSMKQGDPRIMLRHLVDEVITDAILSAQYPGFDIYLAKYRYYTIDGQWLWRWGAKAEGRLMQTIFALRSGKPAKTYRKSVRQAFFYMLSLLNNHRSLEQLRQIDRDEIAATLYTLLYREKVYAHWGLANHRSERFVLGKDGPPEPGDGGDNRGGEDGKKTPNPDAPPEALPPDQVSDETVLSEQKTHSFIQKWQVVPHQHRKRVIQEWHIPQSHQAAQAKDPDYTYDVRIGKPQSYHKDSERYGAARQAVRAEIDGLCRQFAAAASDSPVALEQFRLPSGTLDEDALYQAKYANALFKKTIIDVRRANKQDFVILIDASSSMRRTMEASDLPRYVVAQRMAALFLEALEPVRDAETWVYAFSSRQSQVQIEELVVPSAPGDPAPEGKRHIGGIYPWEERQTPEYESLLAVTHHMNAVGREGVPKVYLILSDGEPDDEVMPASTQVEKIRQLATRQLKAGNLVIHLALGPAPHAGQAYPYSLPFPKEGYPALIRQLGKLLTQFVK